MKERKNEKSRQQSPRQPRISTQVKMATYSSPSNKTRLPPTPETQDVGCPPPTAEDHDGVPLNLLRKYEFVQKLGHGAFGIVWLAVEKETRKPVAIKKIFSCFTTRGRARRAFKEAMLLARLPGHPCLMHISNIVMVDKNDLFLSFQLMNSDLREAIRANILEPHHRRFVVLQVALGLEHLHSLGVLHRDVKPSNILINRNCMVKLTDFGTVACLHSARDRLDPDSELAMLSELPSGIASSTLSGTSAAPGKVSSATVTEDSSLSEDKRIEEARALPVIEPLSDYTGSRWYRAPEQLLGSSHYGATVDTWGLGCVLGEMISGKPVFPGNSTANQLQKVFSMLGRPTKRDLKGIGSSIAIDMLALLPPANQPQAFTAIFSEASAAEIDLLKQCFVINPKSRTSSRSVTKHPLVADLHVPEYHEPSAKSPFTVHEPLDIQEARALLVALRKELGGVLP